MKNTEPLYLQYLFSKAQNQRRPISGTFELTSRCNLNCRMCYIHRTNCEKVMQEEISTEKWLSLIDEMKKSGVFMLLLTGGEPLLRKDFKEIYIYAKKSGFAVSVNTNGTLINDEITELFKEYPPARVAISIYGANEQTYKAVTGDPLAYEKAVNGALKLKKAGIQVKISLTISPFNQGDIAKIFEWAKENGFPIQPTAYSFPPARIGDTIERCSPEQAAANLVACERARFTDEQYAERAKQILSGRRPPDKPFEATDDIGEHMMCRAGSACFWVTYKGEMTPCGMMPEPKCSLLENSFEDAWSYITKSSGNITLPSKCSGCSLRYICEVCAASCFAETGRFSEVPEYLCRKAEKFLQLTEEALNEIQNKQ